MTTRFWNAPGRSDAAERPDCGCGVTAAVVLACMGAYAAYFFFGAGEAAFGVRDKVIAGLCVFFGSAAAGKGLGLWLGRYRRSRQKKPPGKPAVE